MTLKTRLAALLLCALPHLASAQMVYGPATITSGTISSGVRVTPNGQAETTLGAALAAVGGCPLSGCTFSGAVNTSSANGFQIGGLTAIAPGGGGGPAYSFGSPNNVGNVYDLVAGTTTRQNTIYTQLMSSAGSSTVWENAYSSVTLSGPGTASAEINAGHQSIIINAGANSAQSESDEVRLDNSGIVGTYNAVLSTLHNLAGGTATQIVGTQYNLSNDNATAGSIGSYYAIACTPLVGAGSEPTLKFCLRNTDPNSQIATLGVVAIGTQTPLTNTSLFIQGPDALGTSLAFQAKATGGINLLSIADDGTTVIRGPATIGLSGSLAGTLSFVNATSGSLKLSAPTGALTPAILLLPNAATNNDTLAVRGTSQTFTQTQTFSGTANFSGVLQGNGVAAVSCTVGTLATATAVITNGIITHC